MDRLDTDYLRPLPILGRHSGSRALGARWPDRPPYTELELSWVGHGDRAEITAIMREERRQTMNLRTSPHARMLQLRAATDRTPLGWAGFDIERARAFPEIFSLRVHPALRGYQLGALLEYARCKYVLDQGFEYVYLRMDAAGNTHLLQHRIRSGLFHLVDPDELPDEFVSRCHRCELYDGACRLQAYLRVDVTAYVRRREHALGPIDIATLPLAISLKPGDNATAGEPSYRPYWQL